MHLQNNVWRRKTLLGLVTMRTDYKSFGSHLCKCAQNSCLKAYRQIFKNSVSKSIVHVIIMPLLSFIGHTSAEIFGKIDKWRQIYNQTSSTVYTRYQYTVMNLFPFLFILYKLKLFSTILQKLSPLFNNYENFDSIWETFEWKNENHLYFCRSLCILIF